ncbi:MAG: hypothetical protein WC683_14185 [bacterium]
MNKPGVHNALFAAIVGIVLSATAWSISERGYGRTHFEIQTPAALEEPLPADPQVKGNTERMIEQGALSKERARFWSKETP